MKYTILLDNLSAEEANIQEKKLIKEHDSFKNGYNGTEGGDNAYEAAKHPVLFTYIPTGSNVWTWACKTHNRKQAIYGLRSYLSTEQGQFDGKYLLEDTLWKVSCRKSNTDELSKRFAGLEIIQLTKKDIGYLYNGFNLGCTV